MLTQSATHRGAPFVGRTREIGILTHLIQEGLAGSHALIRVAAEAGMGRRRVIAEALNHGPDAEWIHLAPGGVEADLPRWTRTELFDLLDTYPDAPVPSWALHVLAHWSPVLSRRAPFPAVSRERLSSGNAPRVLGAAAGAVLRALTGHTLVIVDAGVWPAAGSPRRELLGSLVGALDVPGAVALAATGDREPGWPDAVGTRTLELGPLRPWQVEELFSYWSGEDKRRLAAWMWRVTGGHPLFLQETVRWLEEMGHLRVDDDHKRVELLDPIERLPVPLFLRSVMEARYQRLPLGAARLLHLLTLNDGRLEVEGLRHLYNGEGDIFDEALSALRRREFLLHRTSRRPLATANPAWNGVVSQAIRRFPGNAFRFPPSPSVIPRAPATALARTLVRLDELRRGRRPGSAGVLHPELASLYRLAHGRLGPAWDGVRGRLAVLVARERLAQGRVASAGLWVRWGRRQLSPRVHPALRRALTRVQVEILERGGRPREAREERARAREEALRAGHTLVAAQIQGVQAEAARRLGELEEARRLALSARDELEERGLREGARSTTITYLRALLDARRLEEVEEVLEALPGESDPAVEAIVERLDALRDSPPVPLQKSRPESAPGWGWGLDGRDLWQRTLETLTWAWRSGRRDGAFALDRILEKPIAEARESGQMTALADFTEVRLWAWLKENRPDMWNLLLEESAAHCNRLGSARRMRFLADALHHSPAMGQPAFSAHFQPILVEAVPSSRGTDEIVARIYLFGRPRVERPRGEWPRSLWPEWWEGVWSLAMIRDFEGESLPRNLVEQWLREAHDTPEASLEAVLHEGNLLLYGGRRPGGGLHLRGDHVCLEWGGIWCDLHAFHAESEEAKREEERGNPGGARRCRHRALARATGELLSGQDDERMVRLRSAVRTTIRELLTRELEDDEEIPPHIMLQWLEGPFRTVGHAVDMFRPRGTTSPTEVPHAWRPGSP